MTEPIKMIEIFSGIGAQAKALNQLPVPHEVIATLDIEKDAILSYASIRHDLEKEMATYEFPTKEQMVLELQKKNVGFDFQKNKHSITMKTNEDKIKQYYLADKLSKNLGDVSLVQELPYADIIVHSSPCQSFSCAGKGEGGDEGSGTTSSLMWESLRLIQTSMPKFVLWENVAAVLTDKHRHNFIKYLARLSELGYESAFDLLNSKNYGIPQNRLRIFCVSRKIENTSGSNIKECISPNKQVQTAMTEIRKNPNIKIWEDYIFPETIPLETRLKDLLEHGVDEKYYLADDRIEKILNSNFMQEKKRIQTTDVCDTLLARDWKDPKCVQVEEPEVKQIGNVCPTKKRANPNQGRVYDQEGIAPALTTMGGGNREPMIVEEPMAYDEQNKYIRQDGCVGTLTTDGSSPKHNNRVLIPSEKIAIVEDQFPGSRNARIYKDYSPTLRQNCSGLEVAKGDIEEQIKWRIRKLTPKECVRLMNFTDKDYEAMAKYVSNSAIYKACGNSIVVACLIAIMSSLFIEDGHKSEVWTQYALHYSD